MLNKVKTSIVWWLAGSTAFSAIVYFFKGDLILALLAFALSFVLFPLLTDIVLKSKYPRLFKLLILVIIVSSVWYYSSLEDKEKALDKIEINNLAKATSIAAAFCKKNNKCADSIDQLENVDSTKYEYESIDNGKDCVLHTVLPSGDNRSDICIDENNTEYLKYLRL